MANHKNHCQKTAAQNNPGLKAKFNEYLAALEKVPQVGALPDPQIAFGYFIQPVETRVGPQQARFGATQMFPWFGTLQTKQNMAAEMAKAKYEAFEEAKSNLFYQVKANWYRLYVTGSAVEITQKNMAILNTFKKLIYIKMESGTASAVDGYRLEMELLDLQDQLAYLRDEINKQIISFNKLLNVNESDLIFIPDLLETDTLDVDRAAILDSIRTNNHLVLQAEYVKASREYQQELAEKAGKPEFSVGFEYIMTGKSQNSMLSAAESGKDALLLPRVGVSIPLYRKKYESMVKEAMYEMEASNYDKSNKTNVLEIVFEKAYADYKNAKRGIDLHEKQYELTQKAMQILEAEYAVDGKNFEEVLRMERKALMHSLMLEKSRADLNEAVSFIEYLMGN